MSVIIIKNQTTNPVDLLDLGITIPASSQRTLTDEFTLDEIDASNDLYNEVSTGNLVVNDGTSDLIVTSGLRHIRLETDYGISKTYYSKEDLQTPGQATISWDNITDVPALASPNWQQPVLCRTEQISQDPPSSPQDGMFYIDTDNDHLYKRVSGTWQDQGAPNTNDRVINKTDNKIYTWNGTAWISEDPQNNWAVVCLDDGDGKQAQYIYNGTWIKIADVDWGNHSALAGLENDDHPQYLNTTRGDNRYYTKTQYITSYSGNANEPILTNNSGKINLDLLPEIVDTLNEAYNGPSGNGSGRSVTTNAGAVILNSSSSDYAPLELTPVSSNPTSGLSAGQLMVKGNTLYMYDGSRTKWISIEKLSQTFSRSATNLSSQWLRIDNIATSVSGIRIPNSAVVIGMSAQTQSAVNATFYLRVNGSSSNLASLSLVNQSGNSDMTLNTDISAGDWLGIYMSVSSGTVSYPIVVVYYAWR